MKPAPPVIRILSVIRCDTSLAITTIAWYHTTDTITYERPGRESSQQKVKQVRGNLPLGWKSQRYGGVL
jgi:hypothetical protein